MESDQELVTAALARMPDAFRQLVERHQDLVWHLVYRMVHHAEDTRELSQETFLRVHQRLHQFRFESSLATWIGRIAYNIAVRHLERKRIPLVELRDDEDDQPLDRVSDDFDLEAACANEDLVAAMAGTLETLPPLQRTIITLYYMNDLSIAEIAAITDNPGGTVKSHLYRARKELRRQLAPLAGEVA